MGEHREGRLLEYTGPQALPPAYIKQQMDRLAYDNLFLVRRENPFRRGGRYGRIFRPLSKGEPNDR